MGFQGSSNGTCIAKTFENDDSPKPDASVAYSRMACGDWDHRGPTAL